MLTGGGLVGIALAWATACAEPSKDPMGRGLTGVRSAAASSSKALRCPTDPWPVLGHDGERTSTSRGCCLAPLKLAWRFSPPSKLQRPARAQHAITSKQAVFVSGIIGQSPALFRVSNTGTLEWTFDSHVDITRFHWPAFVLDRTILNDDGLYIIESHSGAREQDRGLDSWGEVLTDGKNLFANNTWYVAGPKVYAGALESEGAPLWVRNEYGAKAEDTLDHVGGLALSAGILVQTADYRPVPGSGLFAFTADDGTPLWNAEIIPRSHASIGAGLVFVLERREGGDTPSALTARKLSDGELIWEEPVASTQVTAPAVARNLLLVRRDDGALVALSLKDGKQRWNTPLQPPRDSGMMWATTFAVARGSDTIVAVQGDGLALLSLSDGKLLWRGTPRGVGRALHSPVISGGRVIAVDKKGVVALDCGGEGA